MSPIVAFKFARSLRPIRLSCLIHLYLGFQIICFCFSSLVFLIFLCGIDLFAAWHISSASFFHTSFIQFTFELSQESLPFFNSFFWNSSIYFSRSEVKFSQSSLVILLYWYILR